MTASPENTLLSALDDTDRAVINALQRGFPVSETPYADAAAEFGITESDLIERLGRLLEDGVLSRFGPMYHAERLGGELTLAAMQVPQNRFDEVAGQVNAHDEVAHNYARDDEFNMWFVVATDHPGRIAEVISEIETETGLAVHDMPKIDEYFVGLHFEV